MGVKLHRGFESRPVRSPAPLSQAAIRPSASRSHRACPRGGRGGGQRIVGAVTATARVRERVSTRRKLACLAEAKHDGPSPAWHRHPRVKAPARAAEADAIRLDAYRT